VEMLKGDIKILLSASDLSISFNRFIPKRPEVDATFLSTGVKVLFENGLIIPSWLLQLKEAIKNGTKRKTGNNFFIYPPVFNQKLLTYDLR
jgi:hypothetical protein